MMKRQLSLKIIVLLTALSTSVVACQSTTKKQHQDKLQKANSFQNPNADATSDPEKMIGSGNLTDSTRIDTGKPL